MCEQTSLLPAEWNNTSQEQPTAPPVHTQTELKAIFREELKKAWDSPRMVYHCTKTAAYIIEHNGKLYDIDKPSIKTRFCFGTGMCATATDEEMNEASNMVHHALTNQDYFINENLRGLNERIKTLRDIREQMGHNWGNGIRPLHMVATGPHYHGQAPDCQLFGFSVVNTWSYNDSSWSLCWDVALIDKLIAGYEQVKADFTKRLQTYLKRYGLSKVEAWSYIRD